MPWRATLSSIVLPFSAPFAVALSSAARLPMNRFLGCLEAVSGSEIEWTVVSDFELSTIRSSSISLTVMIEVDRMEGVGRDLLSVEETW